jgi:ketosteroid isomerase-like protein
MSRTVWRYATGATLILLSAVLLTNTRPTAFAQAAAPSVLDIVRQFQSAGIKGDKPTLVQIFDSNVTHFHPGAPYRFVGGERLAGEFEAASKTQFDMRFEMVDPQVQMASPDVAVVTYYIVESWADKSGTRISVKEKATEIYGKRNSRWTMLHSHYSAD